MFAVPALPVVRSAVAVELSGPTLWRPYGPYVRQVSITVFQNLAAELDAFKAGQLDWLDSAIPRAEISGLIANPDALVGHPVPGGIFQVDINHHAPLFGIAQQRARTDFGTIDDSVFGPQSTIEPTPEGVHARQAIAHLIDKAGFVRDDPLLGGGHGVAVDDQINARLCTEGVRPTTDPLVEPCSTLAQRQEWDSLHITCGEGSMTACAYRVSSGPGRGRPSNADLQAARDHLLAAGLKDSDSDGLFDFPTTGQVVFAIRNDDPTRLALGTVLADSLDSLFERGSGGEPLVNRLFGGIIDLGSRVFFSQPPDDWNLYIGSWGISSDVTHLFPIYDSAFATNFCGGLLSLFNLNYGFYCNPAFDSPVERGTFSSQRVQGFHILHREAINVAGETVMTIPVYSRAVRTVAHDGWSGLVDTKDDGFANTFNWFNMRPKPGFSSIGGLGLPGGGNPDLLRAGFRQGTTKLNIFHAGTVWESYILFSILDSPAGFNPRPATNPLFEPYETSVTSVTEIFNDNGADQIPGNADDEPVTVLEMTFRNDLQFHDGVQVTAVDFLESLLAYRDVPQGGFGFAAVWNPLLAHSIPIPGSNCGNLCVQLVLQDKTFLHKLNMLSTPILPLHLWDTNRDGKICSNLGLGGCAGRVGDATVDVNFDPVAAGIMIGHGPWMCLSPSGLPGGSCSRTAAGGVGGQSIGPGGSFLLTRNDNYFLCCPTETGTPLHRFAQADVNKDWKIDLTDFVLAAGNTSLQALIISSLDQRLGGEQGKNLPDVDPTNTGNAYPVA